MRISKSKRLVGLVAATMALSASPALAASINVNTTQDEFGTGSSCSLREAIQSANGDTPYGGCKAGNGSDTIRLDSGKRYVRQQSGAADDNNVAGDLDIAGRTTIAVRGRGNATIDAGGLDRVIQILPGAGLTTSHMTITGGDVEENQPTLETSGGGILADGNLHLSRSTITKNFSLGLQGCTCGGGIATSADATLDRVRVLDNQADNIGGAVAWLGGHMKVTRSTFASNTSAGSGGGFYFGGSTVGDSASLRDSTINHNFALSGGGGGGGLYVSDFVDSKLTATNVTIAGNSTGDSGGGVYEYNGDITLTNATVVRNTADADGGPGGHGGGLTGSDITARNSIVIKNHDLNPADPADDCALDPDIESGLVAKDSGCNEGLGNRTTSNPHLLKLAFNGGPTRTIAITRRSGAVNHAARSLAPGRDQRGRRRDSRPDIGAFELIPRRGHH